MHEKHSDLDIVDWMIDIVKPQESESVLDLGCATERQLLRFVQETHHGANAVGIDLSKGIKELGERLKSAGLT